MNECRNEQTKNERMSEEGKKKRREIVKVK
jgi:hypothetical protein